MISINNLSKLYVDSYCMQSTPCKHKCTFTYANGKESTVTLNSKKIKCYLSAIDKDKVNVQYNHKHFGGSTFLDTVNDDIPPKRCDNRGDNNHMLYAYKHTYPDSDSSVNTNIDVNQVSSFEISRSCMQKDPCKHKCTIVSGDTIVTKTLSQPEINYYIDNIPSDKINYNGGRSHFI